MPWPLCKCHSVSVSWATPWSLPSKEHFITRKEGELSVSEAPWEVKQSRCEAVLSFSSSSISLSKNMYYLSMQHMLFLCPGVTTATAKGLLQYCHLSVPSGTHLIENICITGNQIQKQFLRKGRISALPVCWQGESTSAKARGCCTEVGVHSRCSWFCRTHLFLIFCCYTRLNI